MEFHVMLLAPLDKVFYHWALNKFFSLRTNYDGVICKLDDVSSQTDYDVQEMCKNTLLREPVEEQSFSEKTPLTLGYCELCVIKSKIQPIMLKLSLNSWKDFSSYKCGCIELKSEEKSIKRDLEWDMGLSRWWYGQFSLRKLCPIKDCSHILPFQNDLVR